MLRRPKSINIRISFTKRGIVDGVQNRHIPAYASCHQLRASAIPARALVVSYLRLLMLIPNVGDNQDGHPKENEAPPRKFMSQPTWRDDNQACNPLLRRKPKRKQNTCNNNADPPAQDPSENGPQNTHNDDFAMNRKFDVGGFFERAFCKWLP